MLTDVSDQMANKALRETEAIANVGDGILQYKVVDDYTTFSVKYCLRGDDILVSFFPSPEFRRLAETPSPDPGNSAALMSFEALEAHCKREWGAGTLQSYWLTDFAMALNDVAQKHFNATYPRLQAKYTEELKSWWLRAQGFGHVIDYDALVHRFLELMDARLDQQKRS
jgi:hypothetical protein